MSFCVAKRVPGLGNRLVFNGSRSLHAGRGVSAHGGVSAAASHELYITTGARWKRTFSMTAIREIVNS
jgi:hypothetical protein